MITVDEMEGERRKWPEEDRERDVGVSVCPWMELRMSNTYSEFYYLTRQYRRCSRLLPAHRCDGAPHRQISNGLFFAFPAALKVPSSLAVASSSVPPASTLSIGLMIPRCLRNLRAQAGRHVHVIDPLVRGHDEYSDHCRSNMAGLWRDEYRRPSLIRSWTTINAHCNQNTKGPIMILLTLYTTRRARRHMPVSLNIRRAPGNTIRLKCFATQPSVVYLQAEYCIKNDCPLQPEASLSSVLSPSWTN